MSQAVSHPCHALKIASTWNGHSLPLSEQVSMEIERRPKGLLIDFEAPFYDDAPPESDAGPTPELWEHEVVEVFIANAEQPDQYTEIEMGPHGHYLVLRLQGVRNTVSQLHTMRYKYYRVPGRWMGTALIPHELLPPGPWVYNAYAIHGHGPTRQYSACFSVPGPQPDFHQPSRFGPLPL